MSAQDVSLKHFTVQAKQIGGRPFNHLEACDIPIMTGIDPLLDTVGYKRAMDAHVQRITQTPRAITMRLAIDYTLQK